LKSTDKHHALRCFKPRDRPSLVFPETTVETRYTFWR